MRSALLLIIKLLKPDRLLGFPYRREKGQFRANTREQLRSSRARRDNGFGRRHTAENIPKPRVARSVKPSVTRSILVLGTTVNPRPFRACGFFSAPSLGGSDLREALAWRGITTSRVCSVEHFLLMPSHVVSGRWAAPFRVRLHRLRAKGCLLLPSTSSGGNCNIGVGYVSSTGPAISIFAVRGTRSRRARGRCSPRSSRPASSEAFTVGYSLASW